jgi:subtilisin family serine protease
VTDQGSNEQELNRRFEEQKDRIHDEYRSEQEMATRVREQVDYIVEGFRQVGIGVGVFPSDGGVGYMYAEGQILVREEYLTKVWDILLHILAEHDGYKLDAPQVPRDDPDEPAPDEPGAAQADGLAEGKPGEGDEGKPGEGDGGKPGEPHGYRPVVAGVVLLKLPSPKLGVPDVLDIIDKKLGEGVATPNHVLTVSPEVGPCPATEPEVVYDGIEPSPDICTQNSGAGVLIYIADTGLLKGADSAHPWLHGVQRGRKPNGALQKWDKDEADLAGQQVIPPYAGHGTFVAGVARCMAPQADVIVSNVFKIAGSALESYFVRELAQALKLGVDIFHLSITTPTRNDLPLLAFERWLKLLGQYKGVACVVAAGNNGSSHPFWPAAFPEVVSVGALAANMTDRADFSNYGGWVDVYAPGRNLVNAYATGTYVCRVKPYKDQPRKFYGMARWSGTSFSTPIVTGLIAARMFRTGESGRIAAAALLHEARAQAIPGVGAILMPCGGVADDRPGECCCGHHKRPCGC